MKHFGTKATGGFLVLLGGLGAGLAWLGDTCTGNAPDSLYLGAFILPLSLLGFALLAWRPSLAFTIAFASLPALVALQYTRDAFRLLSGTPACDLVTNYGPWEPMGEEGFLGLLWLGCAAVFWLGLALALHRGYRASRNDRDT